MIENLLAIPLTMDYKKALHGVKGGLRITLYLIMD
jgi:hypothetical protein